MLAIVSSGERAFIQQVLRHYVMTGMFHTVVACSNSIRPKPDPDPYTICVSALNLPAKRIVAIEDTPQGIASARAAGLITIGIKNSLPVGALADADVIISRLSELPKVLCAMSINDR
jgi:beta-phosphoglucomutase-like phosphatase (HAD superfamily)